LVSANTGGFKRVAVNKDGTDRELYAKQLLTEAVQFWFPFLGFLAVELWLDGNSYLFNPNAET